MTSRITQYLQSAAPSSEEAEHMTPPICPVLGALVVEGRIAFDSEGWVALSELYRAMREDLHASPALAALATAVAPLSNRARDLASNIARARFNPFAMREGTLKHDADTAILTKGAFDEEKFEALVAHAEERRVERGRTVSGRLTLDALARAAADQAGRDGSLDAYSRGIASAVIELAALVAVLGRRGEASGARFIDVETLRDLYETKKVPAKGKLAEGAPVGISDVVATAAAVYVRLPAIARRRLAGRWLGGVRGAAGGGLEAIAGAANEMWRGTGGALLRRVRGLLGGAPEVEAPAHARPKRRRKEEAVSSGGNGDGDGRSHIGDRTIEALAREEMRGFKAPPYGIPTA